MLNQTVRWNPRDIEYGADPRQVEKLLPEIKLEGANGAVTPSQKILSHQVDAGTDIPSASSSGFEFWRLERTTSPPTGSTSCMRPRRCVGSCPDWLV